MPHTRTVNRDRVLQNFGTVINHLIALGYEPAEIVAMAKYLSTEEPIYTMQAVTVYQEEAAS